MEYKGLEAGTWLVVFKEKTGEPAIGSGAGEGEGKIGGGCEVGEIGRSQVALQANIGEKRESRRRVHLW